MIDGKTKTCALLGNPVEHTLSPIIHNTLAQRCQINMVYVPFLVEGSQLRQAVEGARALNMLGLNVTVPHKSAICPFLSEIDKEASYIGAVNTLVSTPEGFKGYNTDLTGLHRALLSEGIQLSGEEIILLGAGGAARAAAFLCALRGASQVYLLNRSLEKAEAVAREVNQKAERDCIRAMDLDGWKQLPTKKYLVIQGTSVGLAPRTEEAVIEDKAFYELVHTGYDLVYRPAETKFMRLVNEAGGKAFNGLKMLLYQGVEAFELWNNTKVREEDAYFCYEQMKKELEEHEGQK